MNCLKNIKVRDNIELKTFLYAKKIILNLYDILT